jgi:hypothetical protein
MNLIRFSIKKINAELKEQIKDKLEIKTNINIASISQEKIKLSSNDVPLRFDFDLRIDYNPSIAEILFSGSVLIAFKKKEGKKVLEEWKAKKLNQEVQVPLFNFIIAKTSLKALKIEEELNLPPHIPFPKINPNQNKENQNTKYTG